MQNVNKHVDYNIVISIDPWFEQEQNSYFKDITKLDDKKDNDNLK